MQTLTLIHTETLFSTDNSIPKYYLAISSDTIVVLEKHSNEWDVVERIIVGKDTIANICEFDTMDEMLDVIYKVITIIRLYGKIILQNEFYIID